MNNHQAKMKTRLDLAARSTQHRHPAAREGGQLARRHARIEAIEDLRAVEPVVFLWRDAVKPGASFRYFLKPTGCCRGTPRKIPMWQ
jgi:hypothetical protein